MKKFCHQIVIFVKGDQEEIAGSNIGWLLLGNEDFDPVFSLNFPRGHVPRGPTISLHMFETDEGW